MDNNRVIVTVNESGEIVVTSPGTNFRAVFHRPNGGGRLVVRQKPIGSPEFRAKAWWEACQIARQLHWTD